MNLCHEILEAILKQKNSCMKEMIEKVVILSNVINCNIGMAYREIFAKIF